MSDAPTVRDWLERQRERVIEELAEWVRIPSIAGTDEHARYCVRSADWLANLLRAIGFPVVETWPTKSGPPIVFAQWHAAAGAPTVLIYSHHDVRQVKPEQWRICKPFAPVVRGDRLYGRGTSDAKGQVMAHLWGLRALMADAGTHAPPVNVTLLIEGEEEVGSPDLAETLRDKAEQLRADLVLLSDTMTWAADRPAVCTGNRGMMKAHLEIRAAQADLHAGAVAGAAPNATAELARVLAKLHDAEGRVRVPRFYDAVAEPSPKERKALGRLTGVGDEWARRLGMYGVRKDKERSLGELLFTRPAIEVMALRSGDAEPPTTGTQPATARADLDISLVPDQDPEKVGERLAAWVAKRVGKHFEHEFTVDETINQPPYETPPDHPVLGALTEAMTEAWGCEAGRMRNAGGAPTALLAEATGAPVAFFGTGLPEDGWHGPDESVDLEVLLKGAATMALFWPRLAERMPPRAT